MNALTDTSSALRRSWRSPCRARRRPLREPCTWARRWPLRRALSRRAATSTPSSRRRVTVHKGDLVSFVPTGLHTLDMPAGRRAAAAVLADGPEGLVHSTPPGLPFWFNGQTSSASPGAAAAEVRQDRHQGHHAHPQRRAVRDQAQAIEDPLPQGRQLQVLLQPAPRDGGHGEGARQAAPDPVGEGRRRAASRSRLPRR